MDLSLAGKTFVVTGVTSGIGRAVAELLLARGASLVGVGRSVDRCERAENELQRLQQGFGKVKIFAADLSIQAEVRRLAQTVRASLESQSRPALDALINNAATVPFWQTLTPEGFEMQWAVNHLAVFLLTHELLPLLQAAPRARVITVSSGSHYHTRLNWDDIQLHRHYNPLRAYKQTKLANILFTAELNRRMGEHSNVRAFAADPGLVNTDIGLKSNSALARWIWDIRRRWGITPAEAAKGIVFLACEPSIQNACDIYWKHSRPMAPSPYALETTAARLLWNLSSQMCGLKD